MCIFHKWQYLFSNPPSLAMAGLYEGQLDFVICTKCGKIKRTCLYMTHGQKWVDEDLRPIKYMDEDWIEEEWRITTNYINSFRKKTPLLAE